MLCDILYSVVYILHYTMVSKPILDRSIEPIDVHGFFLPRLALSEVEGTTVRRPVPAPTRLVRDCRSPFAVRRRRAPSPSAVRRAPSAVRRPPFAVRRSPFAVRHAANCQLPFRYQSRVDSTPPAGDNRDVTG